MAEDFEMIVSETDNTVIVTTEAPKEKSMAEFEQEIANRILMNSLKNYETKYSRGLYSQIQKQHLARGMSTENLEPETIDKLANGAQNSLQITQQIMSIVKQYVNKDDVIGRVFELIQSYAGTDFTVDRAVSMKKRDEKDPLSLKILNLINGFNRRVNVKRFLRNGIPMSYLEGTYITYLRNDLKKGGYVIDKYPLGLVEISPYSYDGDPVVIFNITQLRTMVRLSDKKDRKGKDLFFNSVEDIVKNNYPEEVYKAWKLNESWVILNPSRVGVIRINNLDGAYGLSPIFKSLKAAMMLEEMDNADESTLRARAKKIIHQCLRKELGGADGNRKAFAEAVHAHEELTNAFRQGTVLYTSQHWVEFVKYVEPASAMTDDKTLNFYRSKVFTALGIGFLDTSTQNVAVANISIEGLVKAINAIGEQFETVINKFYKIVLEENKIDPDYSPTIKILDSEVMNFDMRKSLAEFMYTKLNCSIKKAYEIMGVANAESELKQREFEKDHKWDELFEPHSSFYTQNNNKLVERNPVGRPRGTNKDTSPKQAYDEQRLEMKENTTVGGEPVG